MCSHSSLAIGLRLIMLMVRIRFMSFLLSGLELDPFNVATSHFFLHIEPSGDDSFILFLGRQFR